MMPIVAAVPKEVPVKSETKQQSRKNYQNEYRRYEQAPTYGKINERYRAAGPPDGGDHTDKDKDEEDIFDRADSSSGHCQYLYWRMSLPEGVTEKHQIAEKQGPREWSSLPECS